MTSNRNTMMEAPLQKAQPEQPMQLDRKIREHNLLVKVVRFLDILASYAQDNPPKYENETDIPLHWKTRQLKCQVISLIDAKFPEKEEFVDLVTPPLPVQEQTGFKLCNTEVITQTGTDTNLESLEQLSAHVIKDKP